MWIFIVLAALFYVGAVHISKTPISLHAVDPGKELRLFSRADIASMKQKAQTAPRGRFGKLLHKEYHAKDSDPEKAASEDVQRFLNVFSRGSYVMPHLHPEAGKWEMFVHIDGEFNVAAFDPMTAVNNARNAAETVRLGPDVPLIFVREGCWHSVAALDDAGSVLLEFKPGPYGGPAKDKLFSYQLPQPWAYDETRTDQAQLAEYTKALENAEGFNISTTSEALSSDHAWLRPYTRSSLLSLLKSGKNRQQVVASGPGRIKPVTTIFAVPASTDGAKQEPVLPETLGGSWRVYIWLAGGSVRVGHDTEVNQDNPILEIWGDALSRTTSQGLTAAGNSDGVVLELKATE